MKLHNKNYFSKKIKFIIGNSELSSFCFSRSTTVPSSNVCITWKKTGSPYKVNGIITNTKDSTLKIESGVKVEFQGTILQLKNRHIAQQFNCFKSISMAVCIKKANTEKYFFTYQKIAKKSRQSKTKF